MLIKEYRICLPMTVEEYRIAQLYMIQKKSREESSGAGSGVEILVNQPYTDGPGGAGQYTMKNYHIGSHLPGWFRAILPKSALTVEEEAWNAYPYTKTIYRCPFIEKFSIEIETVYHNDNGSQDNVFKLSSADVRSRLVDYLDIVVDPVTGHDYRREEDPRLFVSEKTSRGPLSENWREEYSTMVKQNGGCVAGGVALMCAYKLCRVEFRYWGMQGKIERFIHDVALRKTMVRAHRQAWCWQDEYFGLTIEDIRQLELETQLALKEKMAHAEDDLLPNGDDTSPSTAVDSNFKEMAVNCESHSGAIRQLNFVGIQGNASPRPPRVASAVSMTSAESRRLSFQSVRSRCTDSTLEKLQTSSSEDEEFFDAHDDGLEFTVNPRRGDGLGLCKASSLELIDQLDDECEQPRKYDEQSGSSLDQRFNQYQRWHSHTNDSSVPSTPRLVSGSSRPASVLFLIVHGGSLLDMNHQDQMPSKRADLSTFVSTLNTVCQSHYPSVIGHIAVRLVACPHICTEALSVLASLTPYHSDVTASFSVESALISENFPLSSVALFVTANPDYSNLVSKVVHRANSVYANFLQSPEGMGFSGQVFLLADSVGSIISYDILSRSCLSGTTNSDSRGTLVDTSQPPTPAVNSPLNADDRVSFESSGSIGPAVFDFEVSDFFMFGSPTGLVLAYRRLLDRTQQGNPVRPACNQLYNIFYSSHPSASRMEPLLHPGFRHIAPVKVPRFQKFPYGDATPIFMVETVWNNKDLLNDESGRRPSSCSTSSNSNILNTASVTDSVSSVSKQWWGVKRMDYAVYCPEALHHFPMAALPHLLHASVWESTDIIAFILRQLIRQESRMADPHATSGALLSSFTQEQPREKWLRRRTTIKLRNVAPNHRANDVIVLEGKSQTLTARFMYGPLDVVSLSGEKVDVHIMTNPPVGKWVYFDTTVTDANGRAVYHIPEEKQLSEGMYPAKMVVRGDHTWVDLFITVLPPKTDAVLFSIDGSFTASVSIMGKDPKVRPGSVDIVRHWHELGYLILYVTARPDMQQRMVVTWLAQHNFPHGMVAFMDGLSAEPIRQKTNFLRQLVTEVQLNVHAAYGSSKDIAVYQAIGMQPNQIYIVGKVSKKYRKDAIVIADGYTAHLNVLTSTERQRPPVGNVRLSMRKGCFGFPAHLHPCGGSKNPVRKTTSLPQRTASLSSSHPSPTLARPMIAISEAGNTVVTSGLSAEFLYSKPQCGAGSS